MSDRYLGESTPKLGFGYMRVPIKPKKGSNWTEGNLDFDYDKTCEMTDYFMKNGFNTYHTAWAYENNEEFLRETLVKRYPRDSFQIADNLPVHIISDPEQVEPMFKQSLERLGVDYIDFFLLHMLRLPLSEMCEKTGVWKFMSDMKAAGKVKHIGFSFHDSPDNLDKILTAHPEVEFVQLQINYADWDAFARANYEIAWKKHHKPVMIMEPVKGGILASDIPAISDVFKKIHPDASNASWALRWVLQLDGLITVFSGMSSFEQMEDNVRTAKISSPSPLKRRKQLPRLPRT
jgi:predicted aldo/keto reductase-like oxidoreductase